MNHLSLPIDLMWSSPGFNKIPFSFLSAKAIRGLHRYGFPYFGELLYFTKNQRSNLQQGNPTFLIRVDDFPRWDLDTELFEQFHHIFLKHNIGYVVGVTPFLNFTGNETRFISDREVSLLQKVAGDGVELALHGFTHEYKLAPYRQPCETCFYSEDQLYDLMKKANDWFQEHALPKPRHYIPPFNTFSKRDFDLLTKEYKIFHGGPLSLSTFGKYGQSRLEKTDVLYLPSFEPFYDRAKKILQVMKMSKRHFKHQALYSITLHFAWENETNYQYVEELLVFLKNNGWLSDNVATLNGC
jgi:predicted deacetylase